MFSAKRISFLNFIAPGLLPAINYDTGNNNVAYFDNQSEDPNKFSPETKSWNNGWSSRNDGVDILKTTDNVGSEYAVGWAFNSEWALYTVQTDSTGMYNISIRIASSEAGGKLQLLYNNETVGDIVYVPNTGGWRSWQNINVCLLYTSDAADE